jgi:hypothetical protein
VRVTNNLAAPISISDVKSSHASFNPVLKEIQQGKEFELAIHLVPPVPAGTAQGIITAKTTSTNLPIITVTAMVVLQPPVALFPAALTLQPGPLPAAVTSLVRLFNNQTNSVAFTNAQVNISNVTVAFREEQPGRLFTATLTFPAGLELPPGKPAEFSINTSHPDQPIIRVPITQLPKPAPAPAPAIQGAAAPKASVAIPVRSDSRPVLPPLPPEVSLPGAPSPEK